MSEVICLSLGSWGTLTAFLPLADLFAVLLKRTSRSSSSLILTGNFTRILSPLDDTSSLLLKAFFCSLKYKSPWS